MAPADHLMVLGSGGRRHCSWLGKSACQATMKHWRELPARPRSTLGRRRRAHFLSRRAHCPCPSSHHSSLVEPTSTSPAPSSSSLVPRPHSRTHARTPKLKNSLHLMSGPRGAENDRRGGGGYVDRSSGPQGGRGPGGMTLLAPGTRVRSSNSSNRRHTVWFFSVGCAALKGARLRAPSGSGRAPCRAPADRLAHDRI